MFVAFSIFLMVLFGIWWSLWLSTGPSPHFGTLAGQLQLGVPRSDFCIHHSICHMKRSMLSWRASGCTSEHAQQKWETYGSAFLNNSDYNSLVRKYVSSELSLAWLGKGVRLECSVGAVARWVLRRWSVYKRESNQTMFVRWKLHRWDMGEAPANTKYIWPGCQTKQSSSVVPVGGISALACNFVMFCLLEDYITPEMQSVVEPLIWCANLIKVAICVCKGECATRDRKGCRYAWSHSIHSSVGVRHWLGQLGRDTSNMNIPNIKVPLAQMKRRRRAYILSILLERARPQVSETHTYFCTLACEQLTFLEDDVERERIVAEADRCQKMQQVKEFKKICSIHSYSVCGAFGGVCLGSARPDLQWPESHSNVSSRGLQSQRQIWAAIGTIRYHSRHNPSTVFTVWSFYVLFTFSRWVTRFAQDRGIENGCSWQVYQLFGPTWPAAYWKRNFGIA